MFDFDLDQLGVAHFACQSGDAEHGFLGVARTGGVGQQRNAFGNVVEHAVLGGLRAAQCHGDDLRACMFDRSLDEVQVVAAGAQNESRLELVTAQVQRLVFHRGDGRGRCRPDW